MFHKRSIKINKGVKNVKTKYIGIAAAISLTAITVCGCGEKEKDYDVYFFNGKSEIAESLETVADEYEAETGKKVKVFTVGTSESSETLRSEIKPKAYPTVFASNAIGIEEWKSAGFAMDASKIHNPQLKALYESVPDSMKLEFEGEGNYGIPYNIEGYGHSYIKNNSRRRFHLKWSNLSHT